MKNPVELFRNIPVATYRFAGGSLTLSVVVHLLGFIALSYLPWLVPARKTAMVTYASEAEIIHYQLTILDRTKRLPHIAAAGAGGHPGSGVPELSLPIPRSAPSISSFNLVSRPVRPDNPRQTIVQLLSPPDLRMVLDQKLPNIVVGAPAVIPKPQIHFNPNISRPTQPHIHATTEPVPAVTMRHVPDTVVSLPSNSTPQPRLPVPTALFANAAGVPLPGQRSSTTDGGVPEGREGNALVVLSSDAAGALSQLNLPNGNRWGELVISAAGNQPGPPAGSADLQAGGGSAANGTGGDPTTGSGASGNEGGGGTSGSPEALSIGGMRSTSGEPGSLDARVVAAVVYPVTSMVLPRKNALIVSAGPMGGGGLDVYGALHCGKIYTVFFQMPGKAWTLQFCRPNNPEAKPTVSARSSTIHLEQGLVPPDAESQFDFRRLPVPSEKKGKMIVLKGVITAQGTVANLQIYQSIVPEMDETARVAFSRWIFKPALHQGKPVAVDILVGIPPEVPGTSWSK